MYKKVKENKMVFGIRAIIEAIEAGKEIEVVYLRRDMGGELYKELFDKVLEKNIPCKKVPADKLKKFTEKNHQGAVAFVSEITYHDISEIVQSCFEAGRMPLILVLDGITDVRNFGAIVRSCECAGVDAVVVPNQNSAPVNSDAIKTSAGALHSVPICRTKDLAKSVEFLRNSGIQIIGVSEKAKKAYHNHDYNVPIAFVLGSEDKGISASIQKLCNENIKIPMRGDISSLNVSVATGIVLFEAIKNRL